MATKKPSKKLKLPLMQDMMRDKPPLIPACQDNTKAPKGVSKAKA